jgi:hypothetical protein
MSAVMAMNQPLAIGKDETNDDSDSQAVCQMRNE